MRHVPVFMKIVTCRLSLNNKQLRKVEYAGSANAYKFLLTIVFNSTAYSVTIKTFLIWAMYFVLRLLKIKIVKNNMLIGEKMMLGPMSIELNWQLVKIHTDSPAALLYVPENNLWRIKPSQAESDENMKKRLFSMLHYHAIYFRLYR